jgi:hypothetical protein
VASAEHPEKENIKDFFNKNYTKEGGVDSEIINNFLKSGSFDNIFDLENYDVYLGQMTYSRSIDNALCYFKDILVEVIIKKPEILKSNEKESIEYILSFKSIEELTKDLIERKINELFYGGIKDIKAFFKKKLNIEMFKDKESEDNFNQLIKQRNLIVHNRGIISKEFASEFPTHKDLIGKRLNFTFDNLTMISIILNNIIVEIDVTLRKKFNLNETSYNI